MGDHIQQVESYGIIRIFKDKWGAIYLPFWLPLMIQQLKNLVNLKNEKSDFKVIKYFCLALSNEFPNYSIKEVEPRI